MNTKERPATVKQVAVNGTTLAYVEQGSGEPLVFIHGAISDYRTWLEQLNALAGDYRVISYSRRGHYPNAPEEAADYTRARHTADLIEFLRALKIERAHLVGHSYGAALALTAAWQEPRLIASLILGEPSPFPALLDEEGKSLLAEQKAGFEKAIALAENGETEAATREFLHTVIGIDAFGLLPAERRAVVMDNAHTLLPMLRHYYDSPLRREQFKHVYAPTLLVTGEISPVLSRLNNKTIDRCLPNSTVSVLKGASHGLQMENPEGFNQLVADFPAVSRIIARLSKYQELYDSVI